MCPPLEMVVVWDDGLGMQKTDNPVRQFWGVVRFLDGTCGAGRTHERAAGRIPAGQRTTVTRTRWTTLLPYPYVFVIDVIGCVFPAASVARAIRS